MPDNTEIELRSEEVQEILTRIPHWLIRWGSLIILLILVLMLFVSWMIKYPDTIQADIIITTQVPPEKIVAKSSGKIGAILVQNNEEVISGTAIAIIENPANYKDIFLLKSITDTISPASPGFPFEKLEKLQLGDVESMFEAFQKEYGACQLNKKLQPFTIEKNANDVEAVRLKERLTLLESQKAFSLTELELLKSDLNRAEVLHKNGGASSQEPDKQKLAYVQGQKNYQSLLGSISQLKSEINDLGRNVKNWQINETKEKMDLEHNVLRSFNLLKKAIRDWDSNYVLRASIDGKVSFLQLWSKNQTVTAGDHCCSVIPLNEKNYIGKLKARSQNSGKIKVGQDVKIRVNNYPDREFGVINGKVKNISLIPDKEGNLLIDVALPEGLDTSYDRKIDFQQEMQGTADIITEDLRLIERLLYQFRGIFSR